MVTLECSFQFYLYSFATSKQSEICVKMCNPLMKYIWCSAQLWNQIKDKYRDNKNTVIYRTQTVEQK